MLADELDHYKERGNRYMDDNIWKIQELYMDEETRKKEEQIENKEVILIKPYEVSMTTSSSSKTSFITDEVKNLLKYMKFVQSVKIVDGGLYFIFSFHFIFLLLSVSFYFSIFRTTQVRVH